MIGNDKPWRGSMLWCLLYVLLLISIAAVSGVSASGQETSVYDLQQEGFAALSKRDGKGAIATAESLVKNHPSNPVAWRLAGDMYLRAGDYKKAIVQFKRYIQRHPEDEADLWQHGIALAMDGQYDQGRKLFELHRTVNPNDVENALWHFYCVAKSSNAENARAGLLPAPGDRRPPMEELLQLYRGEVDEAAVRTAMEQFPKGTRGHDSATFYGELYLAMHADSLGDRKRALELAEKAASAKDVNYMTDVGRVYYFALRDAAP